MEDQNKPEISKPELRHSGIYYGAGSNIPFNVSEMLSNEGPFGNGYAERLRFSNVHRNESHPQRVENTDIETDYSENDDRKKGLSTAANWYTGTDDTADNISVTSGNDHQFVRGIPHWRELLADPEKAGYFLSLKWPRISLRASYRSNDPYRLPIDEEGEDETTDKEGDTTGGRFKPTVCLIILGFILVVSAAIPVIVVITLTEGDGSTLYVKATMTLTVKDNYTISLGNSSTRDYKNFGNQFCNEITQIYKNGSLNKYYGCRVTDLRDGSIVVIFLVYFTDTQLQLVQDNVKHELVTGLSSGYLLGSFQIDIDTIEVISVVVEILKSPPLIQGVNIATDSSSSLLEATSSLYQIESSTQLHAVSTYILPTQQGSNYSQIQTETRYAIFISESMEGLETSHQIDHTRYVQSTDIASEMLQTSETTQLENSTLSRSIQSQIRSVTTLISDDSTSIMSMPVVSTISVLATSSSEMLPVDSFRINSTFLSVDIYDTSLSASHFILSTATKTTSPLTLDRGLTTVVESSVELNSIQTDTVERFVSTAPTVLLTGSILSSAQAITPSVSATITTGTQLQTSLKTQTILASSITIGSVISPVSTSEHIQSSIVHQGTVIKSHFTPAITPSHTLITESIPDIYLTTESTISSALSLELLPLSLSSTSYTDSIISVSETQASLETSIHDVTTNNSVIKTSIPIMTTTNELKMTPSGQSTHFFKSSVHSDEMLNSTEISEIDNLNTEVSTITKDSILSAAYTKPLMTLSELITQSVPSTELTTTLMKSLDLTDELTSHFQTNLKTSAISSSYVLLESSISITTPVQEITSKLKNQDTIVLESSKYSDKVLSSLQTIEIESLDPESSTSSDVFTIHTTLPAFTKDFVSSLEAEILTSLGTESLSSVRLMTDSNIPPVLTIKTFSTLLITTEVQTVLFTTEVQSSLFTTEGKASLFITEVQSSLFTIEALASFFTKEDSSTSLLEATSNLYQVESSTQLLAVSSNILPTQQESNSSQIQNETSYTVFFSESMEGLETSHQIDHTRYVQSTDIASEMLQTSTTTQLENLTLSRSMQSQIRSVTTLISDDSTSILPMTVVSTMSMLTTSSPELLPVDSYRINSTFLSVDVYDTSLSASHLVLSTATKTTFPLTLDRGLTTLVESSAELNSTQTDTVVRIGSTAPTILLTESILSSPQLITPYVSATITTGTQLQTNIQAPTILASSITIWSVISPVSTSEHIQSSIVDTGTVIKSHFTPIITPSPTLITKSMPDTYLTTESTILSALSLESITLYLSSTVYTDSITSVSETQASLETSIHDVTTNNSVIETYTPIMSTTNELKMTPDGESTLFVESSVHADEMLNSTKTSGIDNLNTEVSTITRDSILSTAYTKPLMSLSELITQSVTSTKLTTTLVKSLDLTDELASHFQTNLETTAMSSSYVVLESSITITSPVKEITSKLESSTYSDIVLSSLQTIAIESLDPESSTSSDFFTSTLPAFTTDFVSSLEAEILTSLGTESLSSFRLMTDSNIPSVLTTKTFSTSLITTEVQTILFTTEVQSSLLTTEGKASLFITEVQSSLFTIEVQASFSTKDDSSTSLLEATSNLYQVESSTQLLAVPSNILHTQQGSNSSKIQNETSYTIFISKSMEGLETSQRIDHTRYVQSSEIASEMLQTSTTTQLENSTLSRSMQSQIRSVTTLISNDSTSMLSMPVVSTIPMLTTSSSELLSVDSYINHSTFLSVDNYDTSLSASHLVLSTATKTTFPLTLDRGLTTLVESSAELNSTQTDTVVRIGSTAPTILLTESILSSPQLITPSVSATITTGTQLQTNIQAPTILASSITIWSVISPVSTSEHIQSSIVDTGTVIKSHFTPIITPSPTLITKSMPDTYLTTESTILSALSLESITLYLSSTVYTDSITSVSETQASLETSMHDVTTNNSVIETYTPIMSTTNELKLTTDGKSTHFLESSVHSNEMLNSTKISGIDNLNTEVSTITRDSILSAASTKPLMTLSELITQSESSTELTTTLMTSLVLTDEVASHFQTYLKTSAISSSYVVLESSIMIMSPVIEITSKLDNEDTIVLDSSTYSDIVLRFLQTMETESLDPESSTSFHLFTIHTTLPAFTTDCVSSMEADTLTSLGTESLASLRLVTDLNIPSVLTTNTFSTSLITTEVHTSLITTEMQSSLFTTEVKASLFTTEVQSSLFTIEVQASLFTKAVQSSLFTIAMQSSLFTTEVQTSSDVITEPLTSYSELVTDYSATIESHAFTFYTTSSTSILSSSIALNVTVSDISCNNIMARIYSGPMEMICIIGNVSFEKIAIYHASGNDTIFAAELYVNGSVNIISPDPGIVPKLNGDLNVVLTFVNISCNMNGSYQYALLDDSNDLLASTEADLFVFDPPEVPTLTLNADQVIDLSFPNGSFYRDEREHSCESNVGFPPGNLEIDMMYTTANGFQNISSEVITITSENRSTVACQNRKKIHFAIRFTEDMTGASLRCRIPGAESLINGTEKKLELIPRNICSCAVNGDLIGHPNRCDAYVQCIEGTGNITYPLGAACSEGMCRNSITGICSDNCSVEVCNEQVPTDFCTSTPSPPSLLSSTFVFCNDSMADVNSGPVNISCTLNSTDVSAVNITFRTDTFNYPTVIATIHKNDGITYLQPDIIVTVNSESITITLSNATCLASGIYGVAVGINSGDEETAEGTLTITNLCTSTASLP